jgi:hypothetical protein
LNHQIRGAASAHTTHTEVLPVQRLISPEAHSQVFAGRILHASETLQLCTFVVACNQFWDHYVFIYLFTYLLQASNHFTLHFNSTLFQ